MTYPALLGANPSSYGPIYSMGYNPNQGNLNPPMANPTGTIGANGSRMADGGSSYRRGGGVKRGKMVRVHAAPHELDVMDFLQGKIERDPVTNQRSYSHLEELLKNPHILSKVHQHVHAHHAAHGGHMGHIHANNGMQGDTEIALIGPHTHRTFDHLARALGARDEDLKNPMDGHPQYFSLGGILGGIGSALGGALPALGGLASKAAGALSGALPSIGGMASKAAGALGNVAGMAKNAFNSIPPGGMDMLKNGFGGIMNEASNLSSNTEGGSNILNSIRNFGNSDLGQSLKNQALGMGKDYLSNKMAQSNNPYVQTLGQGFNAAGNAYLGGQSPREALGQGISAAGQNFGGGMGGALQNFGQSIGQGYSPMQTLQHTAQGGFQGMGGTRGLQDMGMQAFHNWRGGQSMPGAFGNMMHQNFQNMLPRRMTPGFINMEGEMPGMDAMY